MTKMCFKPADILLPPRSVDMQKWAVIACDQYTSQPEYWTEVERYVGDAPSTYQIVFPEIYLHEKPERIESIHKRMREYTQTGKLQECVHNGFILTERQVLDGIRLGLVGVLDLEQYEFRDNYPSAVRATEGTILSRIPPRVQIRSGACLEVPHVMVLINDEKNKVIEPLYEKLEKLRKLYDFDLMMNGGHISGYAVEGDMAVRTSEQIAQLQSECNGTVMAVGDGNHSLAAAKVYWTELRKILSKEEQETHPARYALVEVVNLYSKAIVFEPIHRVLFNMNPERLLEEFEGFLIKKNILGKSGDDFVFMCRGLHEKIGIVSGGKNSPVEILQNFLDEYLIFNKDVCIDYIHGEEAVKMLVADKDDAVGILLKGMAKEELFPVIETGGVLPRKSFSMGEADDKRFYLECRKLVEQPAVF